jgi:hypothetical protein
MLLRANHIFLEENDDLLQGSRVFPRITSLIYRRNALTMPRAVISLEEYQALITGLPTTCPSAVFPVAGTTYTVPQAVALVASIVAKMNAVTQNKFAWLESIKNLQKAEATDGETVKAIRTMLSLQFQNNLTALDSLAITPKKPRTPMSAEALLAASAKAKSTRVARGTKSRKQKLAIKGDVTGVNIVPVTTEPKK